MSDSPFEQILVVPGVSSDDVEQEYQLALLNGVENPSRKVIRMRLQGETPWSTFGDIMPSGASLLVEDDFEPIPDPEIINALVDWALQQSEIVQKIIFDFLEEPSHHKAQEVIAFLHNVAILGGRRRKAKTNTAMPFSKFLMQQLQEGPMTREEIYHLARHNTNSRRPEAAARQLIRRFIEEHRIEEISRDTFAIC